MVLQMFLQRALMPLHKPKCVGMYHQQLAYCVTQVTPPRRSIHVNPNPQPASQGKDPSCCAKAYIPSHTILLLHESLEN